MLNYAPSPLTPGVHGPQLDSEWWLSRDGVGCQRPYRGISAVADGPRIITHEPFEIDGTLLFHFSDGMYGAPADRFSPPAFEAPAAALTVNAAVPSPERPFAVDQAYLMAEALDENGAPIDGYAGEACLIRDRDDRAIPLEWDGRTTAALRGGRIRLRFHLRSASIYAVAEA